MEIEPGTVLADKYRVERAIGRGGMGLVVAATHLQLGEPVAIKLLLGDLGSNDKRVQRFLREGRAAARLRSEHVARVYDVGQLDTGTPYLVMEYLEGRDVGRTVREEGPLAIELAVEYLLQACDALAGAHAMGIIHRDIKPSNLFLALRQDGTPAVKIIDFGISKLAPAVDTGTEESDDGVITQTAALLGTPNYMAPEQMHCARDVDARADIWSLGGTLHTMLTGKPPFSGRTLLAVLKSLLDGITPLRQLRPDAPEGLEQVILWCMQGEPQHRYPDVGHLAQALAPYAPPHAKIYADRVCRALVARAQPTSLRSVSRPPAEAHSLGTSGGAAGTPSGPVSTLPSPLSIQLPQPVRPEIGLVQSPLDRGEVHPMAGEVADHTAGPATRAVRTPAGRSWKAVVGGIMALLIGGAAAVWFSLGSRWTEGESSPGSVLGTPPSDTSAETTSALDAAMDSASAASATAAADSADAADAAVEPPATAAPPPGGSGKVPRQHPWPVPKPTKKPTDIWNDPT